MNTAGAAQEAVGQAQTLLDAVDRTETDLNCRSGCSDASALRTEFPLTERHSRSPRAPAMFWSHIAAQDRP